MIYRRPEISWIFAVVVTGQNGSGNCVSGEVYLELDDGSEVLLKAGDCVVQNGTRHAWRNRSSANCVTAVTLVGAERT